MNSIAQTIDKCHRQTPNSQQKAEEDRKQELLEEAEKKAKEAEEKGQEL